MRSGGPGVARGRRRSGFGLTGEPVGERFTGLD
jgi:hypothetical protein